ncbi:MAG TPA: MFS transporter [Candidatus Dormibacteraeota bacterium]|nr:MFS transporter [Candidatus Dormibacteraeota bacterium]
MKVRWWVCFLLFLTWLMSYIDRGLMPMAIPLIGQEFHLSPTVMGVVLSAFFIGYGTMQIPGGIIADKFGPRKTITMGIASWSIFSLLTGTASSLTSLIWIRILFGLGEGMHPPAAFKALSAWFNSKERARANGFVMSSNTIGPMIAPILFATLMGAYGWRKAFVLVSIPGFLITLAVYWYLRDTPAEHPKMTADELAEIGKDEWTQEKIPFAALVKYKALWKLFFIYMTWDVTWWGFQAWLPSYLLKVRGFTLVKTGVLAALPFAAGFIGLMASSYISDWTGKRKATLISVLLGNAFFMLLTAKAGSATTAVIFLTATGFFLPAIQGPFWSLSMDLLPSRVMGYSSGFINTGGQIAGVGAPIIIGALIQWTGHYDAGFIFMAISAGLSALLVATISAPKARASLRAAEAPFK